MNGNPISKEPKQEVHQVDNNRWYVINTNPRCEDLVCAYLSGDAFEVCLPKIHEDCRGIKRTMPLFPGYLFARFDIRDPAWGMIKYTPGVRKILGYGDHPVPVADSMIEEIKHRVKEVTKTIMHIPFKTGDSVVFIKGPFEGCEGLFTGDLAGKERVKVLMRSIYMSYTVEAQISDLKAN